MKDEGEIKERIENYEKNLVLARRKKLEGAIHHIQTAIQELNWVLKR